MNNTKNTILALIGIAVIVFAVWYFVENGPGGPGNAVSTPTTTATEGFTSDTSTTTDIAPTGGRPADVPTESTTTGSTNFVSITQADNNKTVHVKLGDRFSISLGEMDWTLSLSDMTVVSRVKNIATVRGTQGIYTADKVGTTVLSAEGRPICAPGMMCAQYIINVKVTIVVDPK